MSVLEGAWQEGLLCGRGRCHPPHGCSSLLPPGAPYSQAPCWLLRWPQMLAFPTSCSGEGDFRARCKGSDPLTARGGEWAGEGALAGEEWGCRVQGPRAEDHACLGPQLLPNLVQWEPLCDQTVQREVMMNFDHLGPQHDTPGSSPEACRKAQVGTFPVQSESEGEGRPWIRRSHRRGRAPASGWGSGPWVSAGSEESG